MLRAKALTITICLGGLGHPASAALEPELHDAA